MNPSSNTSQPGQPSTVLSSGLSDFRSSRLVPAELGYSFPAEWAEHEATWLSWPHKEASWPGKIESIFDRYAEFIASLSLVEKVCINVTDSTMEMFASRFIERQERT